MSEGLQSGKLKYSHEAMIDLILAEPTVTNRELAEIFGYGENWVGQIRKSDAFEARLQERKSILIDPAITRTIEDRLVQVTTKAIERVQEKLEAEDVSASYALEALGIATSLRGG